MHRYGDILSAVYFWTVFKTYTFSRHYIDLWYLFSRNRLISIYLGVAVKPYELRLNDFREHFR